MKHLDELAYKLVIDWPKYIYFNPIHNQIDYSQIIRYYLWDKIGRAIRIKHNIDFEEAITYNADTIPTLYHTPITVDGYFKRNIFSKKKHIFIPYVVPNYVLEGFKNKKDIKIITKANDVSISKKNIIKPLKIKKNDAWALKLYEAVLNSLAINEIFLIKKDEELLKEQIHGTVAMTLLAENELVKYKPNALYVYSDNHPPFINYVLAAKKHNIPTFTYQHGLDCEHYYLDDCYADYIAVWSDIRKQKYLLNSQFLPKDCKVIGKIDKLKNSVSTIEETNGVILFITRPHKPIKCYSPSRTHLEGLQILQSIVNYIEVNQHITLIIKSHPSDNTNLYQSLINKKNIQNNVKLSNENIQSLVVKSKVIITEDSTAGVEALGYNKPIIHAHFAQSNPVLPFVEYGAAFSGKSPQEIITNLQKAFNLNASDIDVINNKQLKMREDFMPQGHSDSLVDFIIAHI